MGGREIGFGNERGLKNLDGFVIAAEVGKLPTVKGAPEKIQRIESKRALDFDFPIGDAMATDERVGIHEVGDGATGVGLDSALEESFAGGPIVVQVDGDVGETDVRLGERGVKFDGLEGVGFSFFENFRRKSVAAIGAHKPNVRKARVGQSVVGIFFESELEVAPGFLIASFGNLIPEEAALEVSLVGFGVDRARNGEAGALFG